MHQLTTVDTVHEDGSYLFTATGPYGGPEEVIVVPCEGDCDNGEAAGTALPGVDIAERHGSVYLVDDSYEFSHEGGIDDDDGPDSTSHLQL